MKRFLLTVAISVALLFPKSGRIDYSVLALILIVVPIVGFKLFTFSKNREVQVIYFGLFLQGVVGLMSLIYNNQVSDNIALRPFRTGLLIWLFHGLLTHRDDLGIKFVFDTIIYSAIINGAIIIIQYWLHNSGIKDDFMLMPGFDTSENVAYRKAGLASGYPTAGLLELMGLISTYLRGKNESSWANWLITVILVAALSLTSRMALYLGGIIGLIVILESYWLGKHLKAITILVMCAGLVPVGFLMSKLGVIHENTISVMLELFINLLEGRFETESSNSLMASYGFNIFSPGTLLIGNGLSNQDDALRTLDDGFQINFFGGGLLYFVIVYIIFCVMFRRINFAMCLIGTRYWALVISSLYLLAEVKGACIFSRFAFDHMLLLYVVALKSRLRRC